ncbi:hypothetical protein [Nocardia transvalensis]|uniref:hypothetical protein n=1 Tax=Nocardia transvalensis TaxID=37333 RepID=UPI0018949F77|nr:hypothetical protein [Nocardia transvalensis]MBF6332790.1 hypothetical protein [Nocardia transvalensis]
MRDYQAEMDRILADYRAASGTLREQFLEADARTTRDGAQVFADLRKEQNRRDQQQQPAPEQTADRETQAEHDRLLREIAARKAAREHAAEHSRQTSVLPSDWTEEDEARAQGYGPPKSWLTE